MEIPTPRQLLSLGPLPETSARTSEKSLQELFQSQGWLENSLIRWAKLPIANRECSANAVDSRNCGLSECRESGVAPGQTKERSVHELLTGHSGTKFNVNRSCFPKERTPDFTKMGEIHELFILALSLVWFAGATPERMGGVGSVVVGFRVFGGSQNASK